MGPSIRNSVGATIIALAAALGSCSEHPAAVTTHDASLQVYLSVASTAVTSVVVKVAAPDIPDTLAFNLNVESGAASGTISVPTGSSRSFIVSAYDAGGIPTYRGQTTINVQPGTNPTVTIVLSPLTGKQPIVVVLGSVVVIISPAVDTLKAGDTVRLRVTVMTTSGVAAVPVQWATLNPGLATVDTAGLVTAGSPGSLQIVATYAGVGGSAALRVIPTGNYGLQFNGNQIVFVPDAPILSPAPSMTLEFWILFESVSAGQYGVLKDDPAPRQYNIDLNGTNSPGPLRHLRTCLATVGNGLNCLDGQTVAPFNTWMHIAMTYDGTTLRLYLNGALDGSLSINQPIAVPDGSNPIPFTMGDNSEQVYSLHGQLDEVRLWSVARTQGQIQAAMTGGLTGSETALVGYWPLDEGTGNIAHDRTNNGNNGILGTAFGAGAPAWVLVTH